MTAPGGIHHITAIAGEPSRNVAFYTRTLGLRLVKRTVNFDDPGTWYLYYGDGAGSPGSILTFFPYPGARPGRHGIGQAVEIGFAIPTSSLGWWTERLIGRGLAFEGPEERFGAKVLLLRDPDGLQIELVTDAGAGAKPGWTDGDVPAEHALRGFHGVTLWEGDGEGTAELLTRHLRFRADGQDGNRSRFVAEGDGPGRVVEIRRASGFWGGTMGAGTVHHVAFRAADDADQARLREALVAGGHDVTPSLDRQYFHSIYFREPGGVLFEIATDPPGFAVDEPPEALGTTLKLPSWLEPRRADIERRLPPLEETSSDAAADGTDDLGFAHTFIPAGADGPAFPLLLLHGTGGDENDLVPLGRALAPGAALLSPRGRVSENGMPRFFRRLAEGVFDEASLRAEAKALSEFVAHAAERYGVDRSRLYALGFSNGANIAAATMLLHPDTLAGAVLLRPMVPLEPEGMPDLAGRPVLILSGRTDPIVPRGEPERLADLLRAAGADVTLRFQDAAHELTQAELPEIAAWLRARETA